MNDNRRINFRQQLLLLLLASLTIGLSSCLSDLARQAVKSDRLSKVEKSMQYDEFIRQVKQDKIKKVGLSADKTKILFKDDKGVDTLVNIPPKTERLIDTLTEESVEIYVLPH